MMFLQFFIWGAWFVTLSNYLFSIGFEGIQIGRTYLMTNIAAILSPFFIGMIADRFFSSEKVLGIMHLLGAVLMYFAAGIVDVRTLIIVMLFYNLSYMPTLALVNAISFAHMENPGQQFPKIRVWGTFGWIVAGLTILAIQKTIFPEIESSNVPMKIASGISLIMGIYSFSLPHTPPSLTGKQVTIGDVMGLKALKLLKDKSFAIFALSSFLISIPLAFYYSFTNGFLNDMDMTGVAGKMTMGQMSELIFMVLMPWFFIRLGVKKMLLFGMLSWVIRYALFATGNNESLVWMFYMGIILHGLCYDFFFVTGQIYVEEKASKDIRASAQGFVTLLTYGLGLGVGSEISGRIVSAYTSSDGVIQWNIIWWIPAILATVVLLFFLIMFKDPPKAKLIKKSKPAEQREVEQ